MMLDKARRLITPSARSDVPPFMVMDVMAAAARIEARGGRVVHMEVGQPAAPAPRTAIAAAKAALDTGDIGYTEALGIPALRARIARHYARDARRHRRARAHRGDDRLVGRIHPGVSRAVRAGRPRRGRVSGLSAVPAHPDRARLRAGDDRDFGRDALVDHGRRADRDASPHAAERRAGREPGQSDRHHDAPRGAARADRARPKGRASASSRTRSITASTMRSRPRPRRSFSDNAVIINSFSKYFCMTGWRVGWMVVPDALVRPVERLQQNLAISVPTLSQVAAAAAFEGRDEMDAVKHGYEENRRILIEGLPKAGLDRVPAGRRRVLSLCRRVALHRRQLRLRQAHAGGGGRRRDPRHRLRSGRTASTSSASPTRARPPTCARRWNGSAHWLHRR